jgi:hypothetical protein
MGDEVWSKEQGVRNRERGGRESDDEERGGGISFS